MSTGRGIPELPASFELDLSLIGFLQFAFCK